MPGGSVAIFRTLPIARPIEKPDKGCPDFMRLVRVGQCAPTSLTRAGDRTETAQHNPIKATETRPTRSGRESGGQLTSSPQQGNVHTSTSLLHAYSRSQAAIPATMATQLQFAQVATHKLVLGFHQQGAGDRCAIARFDNRYSLVQSFTGSEERVHASLATLDANGGTRFRDSICDFVDYFRTSGRRDRPWLIIVITDGDDNGSTRSVFNAGQYLLSRFNHEQNNFMFTIGVGDDVDNRALEALAKQGGYNHVGLESFELLEALFQIIAAQVVQSITGVVGQIDGKTFSLVGAEETLVRQGIDYGFLIDCSGSMGSIVGRSRQSVRPQPLLMAPPPAQQPACCSIL
ncbi:hypothetical protein KFL_001530100 [Klebsormidium nitens]|uniref:VWFA domain-containing protein n=1 Tax=Klebsormidium nitens TaxID=105231 RepID=A0A1Y1I634_KLENI|nr:hypothetical protein KFL_001530100 [Klebsormidium nitens]|eukprot:GAQ83568.1 hypothetical protein KFL_001530100 [Klebsormidium nitens]